MRERPVHEGRKAKSESDHAIFEVIASTCQGPIRVLDGSVGHDAVGSARLFAELTAIGGRNLPLFLSGSGPLRFLPVGSEIEAERFDVAGGGVCERNVKKRRGARLAAGALDPIVGVTFLDERLELCPLIPWDEGEPSDGSDLGVPPERLFAEVGKISFAHGSSGRLE